MHNSIVINKKSKPPDSNLIGVFSEAFAEYYNKNIPNGFPRVTLKTLAEFHKGHPSLFKNDDKWIIDKHRKKLMDWLVSHQEK